MLQTHTSCLVSSAEFSPSDSVAGEADSADPDPSEEPTPGDAPGSNPEAEPGPATSCEVTLELIAGDCDPPVAGWLEEQLARIATLAGVVGGKLAIAVVDDEQMSAMHQQYCDQPGTTDVLTFDLRELHDEPLEGDLVLCMDEAIRQAGERGHDVRLELLLYAVHGLMHLLGEDDHDEAGYQQMHRREDELLTRAGLGPVFGL